MLCVGLCARCELEKPLKRLLEDFQLKQDCTKWVLDIGMSAPSHPLIQLLDSDEGEKTRELIVGRVGVEQGSHGQQDMFMEFNYNQPYNQLSLTHYTSAQQKAH